MGSEHYTAMSLCRRNRKRNKYFTKKDKIAVLEITLPRHGLFTLQIDALPPSVSCLLSTVAVLLRNDNFQLYNANCHFPTAGSPPVWTVAFINPHLQTKCTLDFQAIIFFQSLLYKHENTLTHAHKIILSISMKVNGVITTYFK